MTRAALAFVLAASALLAPAFSGARILAQPSLGQTAAPPPSGLDLSAAQKAKADARQAQFRQDVQALQADTKMTDAQKRAKYTTLYQAMDTDMLAILTPVQRTQVLKQRQINAQFKTDVLALQANKTLTDAQKKAKYIQLTENARNASLALMSPAQRAEALKRSAVVEQQQQAQAATIAEARRLGQQLQKSETPTQSQKLSSIGLSTGAAIQSVIADKTLSDPQKTAKIVALRKEALSRDLVLLTPAQRALYQRIQALIAPLSPQH